MKKTLIAASVGALMLAAAGTASANSLLFPYFTTASGAQSVLTIAANGAIANPETLHYVYNYGPSCTHYDGAGQVTPNDLLQHSIAAPAAGGFGKVIGTDTSTPFYFPLANSYGFLVVTNTPTTPGAGITGDMAIVDPTTGLVASYAGISNGAAGIEGDFSAITDAAFNLSFFPSPLVGTSWYGVVAGNMNAAILGNLDWTGGATLSNQGIVYDNDEHAFSGLINKKVVCSALVAPSDLMNTAQAAAVGPNGGLIHAVANTFVAGGTGVVMNKLQVVKAAAGAPFTGKLFMHRENGVAF